MRRGDAVYLGDRFLEEGEDARVSVWDRGFLFGDSVFETLRTYGGVPFRLAQHLRRLEHSAGVVGIALPQAVEEVGRLVGEAIERSRLSDAYVRVTVSRGVGPGGISPKGCASPTLVIAVRALKPYPSEAYERGIRSMVVRTRRVPAVCLDPSIKCGNYLPAIQARRELDKHEMIEGVQLGVDGQVVSGTVSNVFVVQGGRLRTPDLASGCLPGVTRACVLELADAAGLRPVEERLEAADLYAADEMFFTNTLMECLPVVELDGRRFGDGPGAATRAIQKAYQDCVARETA